MSSNDLSPEGKLRVQHLAKRSLPARDDAGPLAEYYSTAPELTLKHSPGQFLACSASSSVPFPRELFSVWCGMYLGVPLPPIPGSSLPPRSAPCPACNFPTDPFGHHLMNCKFRAGFISGHDTVSVALQSAATAAGIPWQSDPRLVPRHSDPGLDVDGPRDPDGSQKQADAIIDICPADSSGAPPPPVVLDFRMVHPRYGRTTAANQPLGAWNDNALQQAVNAKNATHKLPYTLKGYTFLAFVFDTYGVLCDDAIRLLFVCAERQASRIMAQAGSVLSFDALRGTCFSRFKATTGAAIAVGMARRLLGVKPSAVRFPPRPPRVPPRQVDHHRNGDALPRILPSGSALPHGSSPGISHIPPHAGFPVYSVVATLVGGDSS